MSAVLVEVVRGNLVEGYHHGNIVVVNREGEILHAVGDPDFTTYWRSSAKPFQVTPLVERGGMEKFNFTEQELALMCSSHNGEQIHLEILESIMRKAELSLDDLECGVSLPMEAGVANELLQSGQEPTSAHNCCSGKHAGTLSLARMMGYPLNGYLRPTHPVQKLIMEAISDATGVAENKIIIGVDGCGYPVHGLPLKNMALAYAKLSQPEGYFAPKRAVALRRIARAMSTNPFIVAGSRRLCTLLMEATHGKLVAKLGAEAVFCIGVIDQGIGIAIKIDDGSYRGLDPVAIEVLHQLGLLTIEEEQALALLHQPPIKNHRKEIIGCLRPVFKL